MPRVVSLYLRHWATDRIRKRSRLGLPGQPDALSPESPLVTAAKDGGRRLIVAVDEAAGALGLRQGHTIAQAQASVPGLVVADATPEADARALRKLAGWCLRYAPVVQPDPPDGLFIDISGAAHLFGGEVELLADLIRRLTRAGLAVRAALADTPAGASAASRFGAEAGGCLIVPPGGTAAALAPLPVAALRLAPDLYAALHRLGIERIGQLAQIPRAGLTLRFGPHIVERYDRALGRTADPLVPLVPAEIPQVRLAFAEPLGHAEGLREAVIQLTGALCRRLDERAEGLRRLDAVFRRVDGRPLGIRVATASPSRDAHHCARLLLERIGELDPGFGIDEIILVASRTESLREHQMVGRAILGGPATEAGEAGLGQLVDKLGVRLGIEHVFRATPVESEYPERSVKRIPALAPASGGSWPVRLPRPSRLVDPPERVHAIALAPDHPPAFFMWRRQRHRVRHADGPERIRGEWWVSDAEIHAVRDYYRVEDEAGRRFWLFRDAPTDAGGGWWLHGFFS